MVDYKLIIGLICVMLGNVVFGSSLATIKKDFKKGTLFNGLYKLFTIVIGMLLLSVVAYNNSDILLISINGINMNMKEAINTLLVSGIAMYGAMDLKKLSELIGTSTSIDDVKEQNIVKVDEENYIKRDDKNE